MLASEPDHVIIATGSAPGDRPDVADAILSVDDFLFGKNFERIAFADLGAAGMELWSAALEAAHGGAKEVTIVTPLVSVGADLDPSTYLQLRREVGNLGLHVLPEHVVADAGPTWVLARELYSGRETRVDAQAVVASWPRKSVGEESRLRTGRPRADYSSGRRGRTPGRVAAIREGQWAAAQLGVK